MAAGRKPQLQQRAFGDEVIGVACAALAVFFSLAFYSYHPGDTPLNQMGLVGHVVADFVCPMLGKACYLLPGALLYGTAVLLHILPFPAPFSQMLSFLFFIPAAATFLALWYEGSPTHVADAGGWIGGFLALHLRTGLNRLGAYVALSPLLLVSFMGVTRFSLRWAGEGIANGLAALCTRGWAVLQSVIRFLLSLFRRHRSELESLPGKSRSPRKEALPKKTLAQTISQEEEDEEEKLPPIIISRPTPPVTLGKPVPEKRPAVKPPIESTGNGKPYVLPPIPLLDPPVRLAVKVDEDALHASSRILESKLGDFGVEGNVVAVRPGPVITTYEFEPAPGVKVNRVVALADDLQMALRAVSVRILAPIPGKAVVGIEVSNPRREKVCLREILDSPGFQQSESPLTLALGKDTVGNSIVADLARMPHLLVAGATGTGKSVSLNVMIMSLLYRASPRDVRFIMIDPKMLELSLYEELPHQLSHVITNSREAGAALQEIVRRMEYR
ncbi:MAG TPA: DNA translocase FtsK 4TM domain-containing protein, partial [Candidatus Binatia bacterium]|nr:DNA translocase FtsK 4TM domain-containing protein [Candidatus Binatia bacterium]